tara:strand:+ start:6463 stop:7197 length:735 start_codon:yes stop_codon:yes gene_type:complete
MKTIGLIPARMGSSRFPGKPLKMIKGKEMLLRVYENAKNANLIDELYIATCDQEINKRMTELGCKVIMTGSHHERCTSRCAEALKKIEKNLNYEFENIVMIQGDEPLVQGREIDQAIKLILEDNNIQIANLIGKVESYEEFKDRNTIKVAISKNDEVIYMSRGEVPFSIESNFKFAYKQVCIIPMKKMVLQLFDQYKETYLEKVESIDMLRLIENRIAIKTKLIDYKTQAVDVISDIEKVERLL